MFSDAEVSMFLDEMAEKIQCINENILLLEQEGESQEVLQEIFRAAHTIKGSSAVMGYEKIASLTHEMENLFDQMRRGTLPVTKPLVEALFMALDTLQSLKDEIAGKEGAIDLNSVMSILKQHRDLNLQFALEPPQAAALETCLAPVPPLSGFDEDLIREAGLKGYQAYWVAVEFEPGCQMKSIRAFLVFDALQQSGDVIRCEPSPEEIQEGRFGTGFKALLLTCDDPGRVRSILLTISEVAWAGLEQVVLTENGSTTPGQALKDAAAAARADRIASLGHGDLKTVQIVQTVRVDVKRLDTLMNLVGELVIDRTRLNRFVQIFKERYGRGSSEMVDKLYEISSHLGQFPPTFKKNHEGQDAPGSPGIQSLSEDGARPGPEAREGNRLCHRGA